MSGPGITGVVEPFDQRRTVGQWRERAPRRVVGRDPE